MTRYDCWIEQLSWQLKHINLCCHFNQNFKLNNIQYVDEESLRKTDSLEDGAKRKKCRKNKYSDK